MLSERIMEAVFDSWCEGECGIHSEDEPETGKIIDAICKTVNATHEQRLYIEKDIQELVCLRERIGFENGFYIGVALMSGKIFEEVM